MIAREQIDASLALLNKALGFFGMEASLREEGKETHLGTLTALGINQDGLPVLHIMIPEKPRLVSFPDRPGEEMKSRASQSVSDGGRKEYIFGSIEGDRCFVRQGPGADAPVIEIMFLGDQVRDGAKAEYYADSEGSARQIKLGSVVMDTDGGQALVTSINFGLFSPAQGVIGFSAFAGLSMAKERYAPGDLAVARQLVHGYETEILPRYADIKLPENRAVFDLMKTDTDGLLRSALSRRPPPPPKSPEGGT